MRSEKARRMRRCKSCRRLRYLALFDYLDDMANGRKMVCIFCDPDREIHRMQMRFLLRPWA